MQDNSKAWPKAPKSVTLPATQIPLTAAQLGRAIHQKLDEIERNEGRKITSTDIQIAMEKIKKQINGGDNV